MLIAAIPLLLLMLWGWWHNRQVDKYEEWQKQQAQESNAKTA
jgi:hypothetical protein